MMMVMIQVVSENIRDNVFLVVYSRCPLLLCCLWRISWNNPVHIVQLPFWLRITRWHLTMHRT